MARPMTKTMDTTTTGFFEALGNAIAPKIENQEEAVQHGINNLVWANSHDRRPTTRQPHPTRLVQTQSPHRSNNPPPPNPERNPAPPDSILPTQQIQEEHQGRAVSPTSLSDAQLSKYLRDTRPDLQPRERSPNNHIDKPIIQETRPNLQPRERSPNNHRDKLIIREVGSRRDYPTIHQGLHHPQPSSVSPNMAGTRRTDYLDVTAARTQRTTPHQIFLKGQAKRQQDATDEWARRTGKMAPPYQFEDFIGKGAYGRVFKA